MSKAGRDPVAPESATAVKNSPQSDRVLYDEVSTIQRGHGMVTERPFPTYPFYGLMGAHGTPNADPPEEAGAYLVLNQTTR